MLEQVFGALEDNEKLDIAKSLDKMCDERNAIAHPGANLIRWEADRLIDAMESRERRHRLRSGHKSALTILQNRYNIRRCEPIPRVHA